MGLAGPELSKGLFLCLFPHVSPKSILYTTEHDLGFKIYLVTARCAKEGAVLIPTDEAYLK